MFPRSAVVVIGLNLCALACAPTHEPIGTTTITSSATLTGYRESEAASADLASARYTEALARSEHALRVSPNNAWARYAHAAALHRLGRTDAAVTEFRQAEAQFGYDDRNGKAVSIYGRARALDDVGRCDEAKAAYDEFARFTSSFDPAASKLARTYAQQCRPGKPVVVDEEMTALGSDIITRDYQGALDASTRVGEPARATGWVDYDRGIALAGLGRTDDALAAYRAAEDRFAATDPEWRPIAIYGRARALEDARRCVEAKRAYGEYADLVRSTSPDDAKMADRVARACVAP